MAEEVQNTISSVYASPGVSSKVFDTGATPMDKSLCAKEVVTLRRSINIGSNIIPLYFHNWLNIIFRYYTRI